MRSQYSFEEDATDSEKKAIGKALEARKDVAEVKYISAEEAWEEFQKQYFADNPELAEGFKNDNPLASSDNSLTSTVKFFLI